MGFEVQDGGIIGVCTEGQSWGNGTYPANYDEQPSKIFQSNGHDALTKSFLSTILFSSTEKF